MVKINFLPENKQVEVKKGVSILQAALKTGVELRHKCGGKGSCTTCKIKVNSQHEHVNPPTIIEQRMLGELQLANGFRLGCQTKAFRNVTVETIEDPLKAIIRKQLQALKENNQDEF